MPGVQNPPLPDELENTVEQLLQLPEEQRIAIGDRLLESVPPRFHPDTVAEWKRRLQEIDDGIVGTIPAHEAIRSVRESLRLAREQSAEGKAPT